MAKAETKGTAKLRATYKRFLDDAEAISPAEYLRRMVASWSNPDDDEAKAIRDELVPHVTTITEPVLGGSGAEVRTRQYLADLNRNNPDGVPGKAKRDIWHECGGESVISWRAFDRIWHATMGPAFKKRGPHRPRRRDA